MLADTRLGVELARRSLGLVSEGGALARPCEGRSSAF